MSSFENDRSDTANETLGPAARRQLKIEPFHMGVTPGLNYDKVEGLLEFAEGEHHR